MDIFEGIQWADRIATIAQIALVVGCPTAGLTYVAAQVLIKEGAKLAAKRLAMAAVAGITATAAASFMSGDGGDDGDGPPIFPPIRDSDLVREECKIYVRLGGEGKPQILDGELIVPIENLKDRIVPIENLKDRLLICVNKGKLKIVNCQYQLPEDQWVNWWLKLIEIKQEIELAHPDFIFTINKSSKAND